MSDAVPSPASPRCPWGTTKSGTPVELFCLANETGITALVTNYGGIITQLHAPDKTGATADLVLGFDTLADYEAGHPYFGTIVGRYANRIANAQFVLDGITYKLDANNGPNSLHGGLEGFDKRVWTVESFSPFDGTETSLNLSLVSPDGDQGFPGELTIRASYVLTADNLLSLEMTATTDAPTVCNLTQHAYFNLDGHDNGHTGDHEIQLNADQYLPVNENLIPKGVPAPVTDTPFDFTSPKAIAADVDADVEQLHRAGGFDHNWLVAGKAGTLRPAASAYSPHSGRTLAVATTAPGIQFYGGNFLDGSLTGKGGAVYQRRSAFCLEPQRYPDSPNQTAFPTAVVRPGETYYHRIEYRFGTAD